MNLIIEDIAIICHEANRSYCIALGDYSHLPWNESSDWVKESAINGVKFHLSNPHADVSASHNNWIKDKIKNGWIYGKEKSIDMRTHPCLLPFDELSLSQQKKDILFKSIVDSLRDLVVIIK